MEKQKNTYQPPRVKVVSFRVESGFQSTGSPLFNPDIFSNQTQSLIDNNEVINMGGPSSNGFFGTRDLNTDTHF